MREQTLQLQKQSLIYWQTACFDVSPSFCFGRVFEIPTIFLTGLISSHGGDYFAKTITDPLKGLIRWSGEENVLSISK